MLEPFWRRAGVLLGKHWKLVGGVVAVVSVVLVGTGLNRLDFATGQDSYLDADTQAAVDNLAYQESFGGETVILLFESTGDATVNDLYGDTNRAELARIEAELREIPEVYSVISPLTSLRLSESVVVEGVGTNALLSAADRDPDPEGKAARQEDISTTLSRLGAAGEQDFGNPDWIDFLIHGNDGEIRGSLASTFPSERVAVGGVLLQPNADLDTLAAGTDAVLEVVGTNQIAGFDVVTTGSPVFLGEINDYLQGGMLTLGAAALAVMALVLVLLFKVRWRLLPLLSVLVGVLWTFSVVGLVGLDLSLVTIAGLPILIGLGVDFAIQIQNRVEEEVALDHEAHPISETLANLAPALLVATVAAVAGFMALQVSRVPMIRDFGVMLSIGIVVLVVTGIVIPTAILGIREYTKRTEAKSTGRVERFVVRVGSMPARVAPVLVVAAAGLFVAGVAMESSFEIESDPVEWIDQDSATVADVERLEDATGFSSTLGVLVEANDITDDQLVALLHEFTRDAEDRDEIVSTSSLVNTIGKVIAVPGASDVAPTAADVRALVDVLPADIAKALVSDSGTATQINLRLAPSSLEDRAVLVAELEADLADRLDALPLDERSPLLEGLEDGQPAVRAVPAGLAVVGVSLLDNLSANRALLTYLGLVLAAAWLTIRYRNGVDVGLALVPVVLAVGASSVLVGVLGVSLSPLTTVSGPLVVATCTEFSVLILSRYREERERGLAPREASDFAAARTGQAFFTSAATTIGGFAVLVGSALPLLRDFGIIVTLNVAVALLAALVVLPPLLVWSDRSAAGVLAAANRGSAVRPAIAGVGALALIAVAVVMIGGSQPDDVGASEFAYAAPQPAPADAADAGAGSPDDEAPVDTAPEAVAPIDASSYPAERPAGLIDGTIFDLLTAQGADPQAANCTGSVLLTRVSEDELIALGIATFAPEAVAPVEAAAVDCGVPPSTVAATIDAGLG